MTTLLEILYFIFTILLPILVLIGIFPEYHKKIENHISELFESWKYSNTLSGLLILLGFFFTVIMATDYLYLYIGIWLFSCFFTPFFLTIFKNKQTYNLISLINLVVIILLSINISMKTDVIRDDICYELIPNYKVYYTEEIVTNHQTDTDNEVSVAHINTGSELLNSITETMTLNLKVMIIIVIAVYLYLSIGLKNKLFFNPINQKEYKSIIEKDIEIIFANTINQLTQEDKNEFSYHLEKIRLYEKEIQTNYNLDKKALKSLKNIVKAHANHLDKLLNKKC